MVATGVGVAFLSRRLEASSLSSLSERLCRVSGAYSVDATWSAVTFAFPGLRGLTAFWGRAGGGRRDMVVTSRGVATRLLSRRADPSRLGGRDVLVVLGARRRWSFRCEGSNGSALLVEVRLFSSGRVRVGQRRRGGSRGPRS
ncbi:hypothetical protein Taro_029403 [Colocasia esculenta]|uniref:Uncharacterized protein n=1 Tax=Colocasia esculenta TaxID=4460 RepID=A0A843VT59_COLES|nr:hypothetical protein [Colocasia esculenta]